MEEDALKIKKLEALKSEAKLAEVQKAQKIKNLKASLRGKLDQVAQHQLALN